MIPLAGLGVFLGLSGLTVSLAKAEGVALGWLPLARAAILAFACAWSIRLAWRMLADVSTTARRVAAFVAAVAAVVFAWGILFFGWWGWSGR